MKEELSAGLALLREKAGQKKRLTVPDILAAFPGVQLDTGKVTAIYAYLEQEGIELEDYVPHDTASFNLGSDLERLYGSEEAVNEEEQQILDIYRDELAQIKPLSTAEEKALTEKLLTGSRTEKKTASDRLAEGNLHWVVSMARSYTGKGVPLGDLIQEGNIGLLMGLAEFNGEEELTAFLEKKIRESMKALLKEQAGYIRTEQRMASDANRILETVKEAEEETGEAVSAAELARKLGMSVSRVEEVLKESAKAIRNEERNA